MNVIHNSLALLKIEYDEAQQLSVMLKFLLFNF